MKKYIILFVSFLLSYIAIADEWILEHNVQLVPGTWSENYTPTVSHIKIVNNSSYNFPMYATGVSESPNYYRIDPGESIICDISASGSVAFNCLVGQSGGTCSIYILDSNNFNLTVTGGTGSGSYAAGTNVSVSPTVPQGQHLTGYTLIDCEFSDPTPMYTFPKNINMPANNCSVTFNIDTGTGYALEVVNGSGSGFYDPSTVVNIAYVPSAEGKRFVSWDLLTLLANQDGSLPNTTLTMPEYNYVITAIEEDGEDEGNGYNVWVDNFSELSGIITNPILNAFQTMGTLISEQALQVQNAITDMINDLNNNMIDGMEGIGGKIDEMNTDINSNLEGINDNMNSGLSDVNSNLGTINSDMNSGFSDVSDSLGGIDEKLGTSNEKLSGIDDKIATTNEKLGESNEKLGTIIDTLTKPSMSGSPGPGTVPDGEVDGSKYNVPENAFALNKIDPLRGAIQQKFGALFTVNLTSPNNAILTLPFSQIPMAQYHGLTDFQVKIFDNPTLMPFIALIRELLLCSVYIFTVYAIIRILRTWEHK
jgi:hypothetical protein